jgi:ubiquinone/menaquinone biosynthesis C-methylase UbiE
MQALWRRIIAFGFRLLYNEAAWLYDPVSWLASLGRWRQWQKSIWPYLPPAGQLLEVGCGPGHLLLDLARAGYRTVGIDLSPSMLRLARQRPARRNLSVSLCRGRAGALPFAARTFDALVLTFPTAYVYHPAWLRHAGRLLKPAGRLIVVEMVTFDRHTPAFRFLEWLYRITGQRGPAPDLPELLRATGLSAYREHVQVAGTTVSLVIAESPASEATNP